MDTRTQGAVARDALHDVDRLDEKAGAENAVDDHAERKLVWKIDLLLMPLLTFSFGIQFYDKFVFSSAAVFGMLKDLDLTRPVPGTKLVSTQRYSTATAAFYWGYIIGVLPIALVLQRFPVAKAISLVVFIWGAIVMLTVVVTNYPGAVAQRFFLGLVESAVSPGFVLVTSMWYTPAERPLRLGIWYSATGLFTIFSGVLNYAIGHITGSLAPWKYMYLVAGTLTILWSLVLLALLPDSPAAAPHWLFGDSERALLVRRMNQSEYEGAAMRGVCWRQVGEAARDPHVWLMTAMGAAIYVCNGGVTAFGSLIIKSFGYSSLRAILLQTPGGAATCISIYLSCWLAGRCRKITTLLLPLTCLPVLVGAIIIWRAPWHPRGWPLFGYYLLPVFGAPYVLLLALLARNVKGGTKRAAATGAVFVGYNVGNIIGPYLVDMKEAPVKYRTTWIAVIVVMCLTIAASLGLRVSYARENSRRDKEARAIAEVGVRRVSDEKDGRGTDTGRWRPDETSKVEDLTDWEDRSFRYSL